MSTQDDIPVSGDDELTVESKDAPHGHVRRLGEFKPSNVPLSAAELEHRQATTHDKGPEEWAPRTLENVQDVNPLEDDDEDFAATNRSGSS